MKWPRVPYLKQPAGFRLLLDGGEGSPRRGARPRSIFSNSSSPWHTSRNSWSECWVSSCVTYLTPLLGLEDLVCANGGNIAFYPMKSRTGHVVPRQLTLGCWPGERTCVRTSSFTCHYTANLCTRVCFYHAEAIDSSPAREYWGNWKGVRHWG